MRLTPEDVPVWVPVPPAAEEVLVEVVAALVLEVDFVLDVDLVLDVATLVPVLRDTVYEVVVSVTEVPMKGSVPA